MQWFKHDTDANQDAKLKRVRMKYGLEGYGLYWYCLELIGSGIDKHNLTFELEHDSEIIGFDTGIHADRVSEMMTFMVDQGLFENNSGMITCYKMLKRLDQSMTSNKEFRLMIDQAKNNNHDGVMTSHDGVMMKSDLVMQEEKRIEENRIEKIKHVVVRLDEVAESYSKIFTSENGFKQVKVFNKKRQQALQARIKERERADTIEWWNEFFMVASKSRFLTGSNDRKWKADLDFFLTPNGFAGVIEGKYK